ncbi:FAD-binding oxidoreductase [Paenibacillus sp. MMS20-IR301]|uniref:NAD(P)/FAD-dependent oxidoreductase n=1 Tax=Paenibacillus sp. MMS20-IR301 TaxID=2895946 RepID=UPI0028E71A1C|nr:FAD-binding oxidoreductase [Paenibacillus sp. MMS20-IR301]WNS45325.1 FAD-binding oxidoreductase [Paenibacillus sp. MMS20-IR301]
MKKVIVIGAGILGASTAYQLAKLGTEVLVVDRKDQGQATDAAAGIICPWLSQRRNQAWYRLAKAGARFYPQLIEELERGGASETGYARVGALSIHNDETKLDKIEARASMRLSDAPEIGEITRLSAGATRELFPLLAEEYASVHISGAARVDGRALRDVLLHAAQHYGARLIHGEAALQYEAGRVIGVSIGAEIHVADEIIVCAGAWAAELLQPLGITFKVTSQKGQIMHLHAADQKGTEKWPVVIPPSDQYLLAFAHGKLVIGATHENNVAGYATHVTAGGMQEVLNKGLEVAPALEACTLAEVRTGFRPFTPGFLPVIGALPGWKGLFTANGLGASGLTMGPFIGSQLAKLALGHDPDIDLSDYDVRSALEE